MKKNFLKKVLYIVCFIIAFSVSFTFAGDEFNQASEEVVFKNLLNTFLNIFTWIAYAITIGVVIIVGVKYVMSGANEKADLKGKFPKILIGIALIALCFTIAQMVAGIAGNDNADDIIDVGSDAGDHFLGGNDE